MSHTKAAFNPNICRSCGNKMTEEDRAQYRTYIRWVTQYCRTCINTYKTKQVLAAMNPEQRVEFIRETRQELQKKTYSRDDIDEASKQLRKSGFTEDEVKVLLKGL